MCVLQGASSAVDVGGAVTTGWQAISTGLKVGSQLLGAVTQASVAEQNNRNVVNAAQSQINQLSIQQGQINNQAAREQSEIARQAMAERARLITAAGEAGVAGGVLDRLNYELSSRTSDAITTSGKNREMAINENAVRMEGVRAQANSQMRDESINWLNLGLQIAGTGAEFASTLKQDRYRNGTSK